MSRLVKELIVGDLERKLGELSEAVIINYQGLTAEETGDFRCAVRESGATINVVKNTLVRRIFDARGLQFDADCYRGQTAVVFGNDDAVTCSKTIAEWRKKNKKPIAFKGGILAGEALDAKGAESLTTMPSVQEIKQMLVSAVAGPLTAMVGITNNVLTGVPGVLQAIADEKKEGE